MLIRVKPFSYDVVSESASSRQKHKDPQTEFCTPLQRGCPVLQIQINHALTVRAETSWHWLPDWFLFPRGTRPGEWSSNTKAAAGRDSFSIGTKRENLPCSLWTFHLASWERWFRSVHVIRFTTHGNAIRFASPWNERSCFLLHICRRCYPRNSPFCWIPVQSNNPQRPRCYRRRHIPDWLPLSVNLLLFQSPSKIQYFVCSIRVSLIFHS